MAEETAPIYLSQSGPQQAEGVFIVGSAADDIQAVDVLQLEGVTVVGASEILPADDGRFALTVRNASDTQMRLRVTSDDAVSTDYPLDAGRGYEFPVNMIPRGSVSIYCTVADKAWNVMYSTRSA